MPTLRPLHDYSEHDVINLFSISGAMPVGKGTVVKMLASGWRSQDEPIEMFGAAGNSYNNTVSQRYRNGAQVAACNTGSAGVKDIPLGMTLYDVRETDENGEKLIYHPRKAAENDWVISGQAVPVLTRGVVLYSGATLSAESPALGQAVYTAANGELSTGNASLATAVGKTLGQKDGNGHILLKLEL